MGQLEKSEVIRLEETDRLTPDELGILGAEGELAAALVIPSGYAAASPTAGRSRLILYGDPDLRRG